MTTITRPVSPKQIAFVERLMAERVTTGTAYEGWVPNWDNATTKSTSGVIDYLMLLPYATTAAPATPGYYVQGETMIVVVENKAKTSTYAKVLTNFPKSDGSANWSWEYAPGVGRTLAGLEPMTVAQAAAFGYLYGKCFKCLRNLTVAASVEAGMGPVCRKALR